MRQQEDEFQLPREIREGLQGLYEPGSARGMDARDRAVLSAARRAGEAAVWRRRRWWIGAAAGVAAAVALAIGLPGLRPSRQEAAPAAYARTGDIRDAFYLARELKADGADPKRRQALEAQWDVNKDGVVDGTDVETLAKMAVKVSPQSGGRNDVAMVAEMKGGSAWNLK